MNGTCATGSDKAEAVRPSLGYWTRRGPQWRLLVVRQGRVSGHGYGMEAAVRPVRLGIHALHVLLKKGVTVQRAVILYGLPPTFTAEALRELLSHFGAVQ